MGFFDRFKGKKETKPKEVPASDKYMYEGVLPNGNKISISGVTRLGRMNHRNGANPQELVLGRIIEYRDGDAIFVDSQDYIAFEIRPGQLITGEILAAVATQYLENKPYAQSEKKDFYVGEMIQQGSQVYTGNINPSSENEIHKEVTRREQQRADQIRESRERNAQNQLKAEEIRVAQDEALRRQNNAIKGRERAERLAHPSIERISDPRYKYIDYDGTDMETGDWLRIRQADKVCKNYDDGTYLYSAYINKATNQSDVEFTGQGRPTGYPVCFTLPGRLEDIVNSGNPEQIRAVLQLLSDPRNFQDKDSLTFIGSIDSNNIVSRQMPPEFTRRVQSMKQEFQMRFGSNQPHRNDEYDQGDR